MKEIVSSVGQGGVNHADDVRIVQELLNRHRRSGQARLDVDGRCGPLTIAAIRDFQQAVVGLRTPDGRVDPGGKTIKALNRTHDAPPPEADTPNQPPANASNLSGAAWWRANQGKYPNSNRLEDLEGGFRDKCTRFIQVLRSAGATVSISSTLRNPTRAHLMHYSWKVAKGMIRPSDVPAHSDLNLVWDHGSDAASRKAAQEMVDLFHMAHIASLTSNHIAGKAIDMTISWHGNLILEAHELGRGVTITSGPRSGDNLDLHRVGESFGVYKLRTDPPHWSHNGK